MDSKKNIKIEVENTLDAFNTIQEVNVSPFFKQKTLQRLFTKKESEQIAWTWFTPKLQLATLVSVIIINLIGFTQMTTSSTYDENINVLAETYGMSISTETSILIK